jgi:hypothetical protein
MEGGFFDGFVHYAALRAGPSLSALPPFLLAGHEEEALDGWMEGRENSTVDMRLCFVRVFLHERNVIPLPALFGQGDFT